MNNVDVTREQIQRGLTQGVAEGSGDLRSLGSGDVVQVHQHRHGKDMGKYGAFNIERETPTVIVVYDHNTGEMLKFNRVTGRGIGPANQLMIRQGFGRK